jgi:hypothetical protein
MQAPSGSRGASVYSLDALDDYIEFAQELNETANVTLPRRQQDVLITSADVNLRDQIRRNDTMPLQFAYEAADCRIFFTPKTVFNMQNLWQYAADAIWNDPNKCVQGSTGYASKGNTTNTLGPQTDFGNSYNISTDLPGVGHKSHGDILPDAFEELSDGVFNANNPDIPCPPDFEGLQWKCDPTQICAKINVCVGNNPRPTEGHQCVNKCVLGKITQNNCPNGRCKPDKLLSKGNRIGDIHTGFCEPTLSVSLSLTMSCPKLAKINKPVPADLGYEYLRGYKRSL